MRSANPDNQGPRSRERLRSLGRRLVRHRSLLVLGLVLLTAAQASAEYCKSQGKARVPSAEAAKYDRAVLLSPAQVTAAEERHLRWGKPECSRYLFHQEFVLCYDPVRRVPLWAIYRLDRQDVKTLTRRNAFRTDPRLLPDESATCADYEKRPTAARDFDRGHTVPNADMNRSKVAQANTYFLSNMTPQYARFNEGVWAHFEDRVRGWAKAFGTIYVMSGSVFDWDDDRHPDTLAEVHWKQPTKRVAIPSHYFKIVVHERPGGGLETLAVLLPHVQKDPPDFDAFLQEHLVSIQEIRERTGVEFFLALPGAQRKTLEAAVASGLWPTN